VNPLYRHVLLPPVRLLTRRDAEVAMDWHLGAMKRVQRSPRALRLLARGHEPAAEPLLAQDLMGGVRFPHPFGIAAGLDKNAAVVPAFVAHHSPGFVEVGTVTLRPQPGNPRPRIVRHGRDHLINSMGFPNAGAEVVAGNLRGCLSTGSAAGVPIGVNIGRNKDTTPEDAAAEYAAIVRTFRDAGAMPDYVAVNVSSPNTPGLRAMQDGALLAELLAAVAEAMESGPPARSRQRLLVKLAPDLTPEQFDGLVDCVLGQDVGGLILTNTRPAPTKGGLSGPDLYPLSSRLVRLAAERLPAGKVIVATGGMDDVDRVYEMLRHADLVGVYTGLVLKGPGLLRHLRDGVARRMRADGVSSLAELRSERRVAT
jgi:dihydroorotate dehydrogenase